MVDVHERKRKRKCLLLPNDRFKTLWTIVIVILLIYTAIFVPYKIAFIEDESTFLTVLEAMVDILFGVDIFISFCSAVEDKSGKLIVDHKEIAKVYLKGWFWLDFLACFPFQLIDFEDSFSNNKSVIRLARLPRLYRLVRLLRMVKMLRVLKNSRIISDIIELLQVNPAMTRLTKILSGVLYLVHVFACIWFFVANFENKYDSWADQMGLWDEEPMYKYLISVYWAF